MKTMTIELRDLFYLVGVFGAFMSIYFVNRNAKRATAQQVENTDLTRIRDLRAELKEAKEEVEKLRAQMNGLAEQMADVSRARYEADRHREEMLRYARMPGMSMADWLSRFDDRQTLGPGIMEP